MNIINMAPKRTGSSLLSNILWELGFESHKHHRMIVTSDFIVCPIRDPRDVMLSFNRFILPRDENRTYNVTTEGGLMGLINNGTVIRELKFMVNCYNKFNNHQNGCVIRYENFINDYDFVANTLEEKLNLKIDEEARSRCKINLSFDKMKAESDKSNDVKSNDVSVRYCIHRQHISNDPQPNKWEREIPEELHSLLNDKLSYYINSLNYQSMVGTNNKEGINAVNDI